jgi:hypothetical protein
LSAQSSWRVGLGIDTHAQRNPGESAYRYTGAGYVLDAGIDRRRPASDFAFGVSFAQATLHSSISNGDSPSASLDALTFDARYARVVGNGTARVRWSAGVDLQGRVESTTHTYADPSRATDDFQFEALSVGPFVRTAARVGRGVLTNDASVPIVGAIDYPYSDANANGASSHMTVTGVPTLIGFDDAVSYRAGRAGQAALVFTYRLSYLRYDLGVPRRHAHESLLVYASVPFHRSSQ